MPENWDRKDRIKVEEYEIPANLVNMVGKLEKVHGDPTFRSMEYRLEIRFEVNGILL
jgi:hypothetical protein